MCTLKRAQEKEITAIIRLLLISRYCVSFVERGNERPFHSFAQESMMCRNGTLRSMGG